MGLSQEQIEKLLEWFVFQSETKKRLAEERKKAYEENHKWINPDVIQKMSDEELEIKFLEYYKSGGGRQNLNQIYRDRIIRNKSRYRETLLYLLNENVDIRERIDQILSGNYRIEGFGKAILTSFLMDYNPEKYCLWNNKTEMGFSVIGWKVYESKDNVSTAYLKVLDSLKKLRDLVPKFKLTFDDIDLFLHTISAEEEGIKKISEITNSSDSVECECNIPTKTESMEFALEKNLEDFITDNFDRIDFGTKLKLYQDEETTGRQYQTPIGKIDLLAIDNEKKEFVIIELKKGKSSDIVVGQILRYMGWVKENLVKGSYADYNVSGIIILKEKDEKLEYALKLI